MGPTEWTVIGVGIALLIALGSFIKFVNASMESRLNASTANVRSEISEVRTEVAELKTELKGDIANVRTEIADLRTELKGDIANVRTEIADLRTELKGDIANVRTEIADLRAELKGDMAELRGELKLDFQANRAEIITNRRILGRFALHRHGDDGLPMAPLTDALEPLDGNDPSDNENGSD
jgi:predicted  nucleic acid-binding Zn-ribbon protein